MGQDLPRRCFAGGLLPMPRQRGSGRSRWRNIWPDRSPGSETLAGNAAGGVGDWQVCSQTPSASVDTEEQRRPTASGHSDHPGSCGSDGGSADSKPHLRGGPVTSTVRVSSWSGRKDGSTKSVLARDGAREERSSGCGSARLLHVDSACSLDAKSDPAYCRWAFVAYDQALVDSASRGTHRRPPGSDYRSTQDQARHAARWGDFAAVGNLLLSTLPAGLATPRSPRATRRLRR